MGRFVESTLVLPLPIFCSEPTSSSFSLFLFFMTPAIRFLLMGILSRRALYCFLRALVDTLRILNSRVVLCRGAPVFRSFQVFSGQCSGASLARIVLMLSFCHLLFSLLDLRAFFLCKNWMGKWHISTISSSPVICIKLLHSVTKFDVYNIIYDSSILLVQVGE